MMVIIHYRCLQVYIAQERGGTYAVRLVNDPNWGCKGFTVSRSIEGGLGTIASEILLLYNDGMYFDKLCIP